MTEIQHDASIRRSIKRNKYILQTRRAYLTVGSCFSGTGVRSIQKLVLRGGELFKSLAFRRGEVFSLTVSAIVGDVLVGDAGIVLQSSAVHLLSRKDSAIFATVRSSFLLHSVGESSMMICGFASLTCLM